MANLNHQNYLKNIDIYKQMHDESYSAQALLPNGENAHINIQEPKWWYEKILEIIKIRENLKIISNCSVYIDGKLKALPLEFNDKINNYI